MKFLSNAKSEIICALFNCGCRGDRVPASSRHFFVIAITDGRLERVGKKDIEHSIDGLSADI
jgi:hypothetical protein